MNDTIGQLVDKEFKQARNGAIFETLWGWLRRRPSRLIPLDELRTRLLFHGQRDRGMQTVPLDRIVGSEGRSHEFDRRFRPRREQLRARWTRIGRAAYELRALPAIELVRIGEVYFVRDGNHRVSVARQRGQQEIDAHVVELETNVPLPADLDLAELDRKAAQSRFVNDTDLARLRPDVAIPLKASDTATYEALRRNIIGHQYFMGLDLGRPVAYAEAVGHWHDVVYVPQIEAQRRVHVGAAFPGRTETNLFVSIVEHRYFLTERTGSDPGPEAAAIDYMAQHGPWRLQLRKRGARFARERLQWLLHRGQAYAHALLALSRRRSGGSADKA